MVIMEKISVLLVLLGHIAVAQAQNCSRPLALENMSMRDEDILTDTFPDGSKARFVCNSGYNTAGGSGTITCTAGTWSGITLKCERINCGSAGEILNGDVNYQEETFFGDKVTFSCNPGFILVGITQMFCGVQGWMGRLPTCEVVVCDPPPHISNGAFSPDKEIYEFNQQVTYSCLDGLTLNGSALLTCLQSGRFDKKPPTCIDVSCPDFEVTNGEQKSGSRPPHGYKATMIFECNKGYVMEGSASVTCGLDSNWSKKPLCKLLATTTTTTAATTATTTTTTASKDKTTTTPAGDKTVPTKTTPVPDGGNKLFLKVGIPILATPAGISSRSPITFDN